MRLRKLANPCLPPSTRWILNASNPQTVDFLQLGFPKIFPVTAIHGEGIEALVDAATALLPLPEKIETTETESSEEPAPDDRSPQTKKSASS